MSKYEKEEYSNVMKHCKVATDDICFLCGNPNITRRCIPIRSCYKKREGFFITHLCNLNCLSKWTLTSVLILPMYLGMLIGSAD